MCPTCTFNSFAIFCNVVSGRRVRACLAASETVFLSFSPGIVYYGFRQKMPCLGTIIGLEPAIVYITPRFVAVWLTKYVLIECYFLQKFMLLVHCFFFPLTFISIVSTIFDIQSSSIPFARSFRHFVS